MEYSEKMHRVSMAVLQAGVRQIDQQIKAANDRGDAQKIEQLLMRRHNAAHYVGQKLFKAQVQ